MLIKPETVFLSFDLILFGLIKVDLMNSCWKHFCLLYQTRYKESKLLSWFL